MTELSATHNILSLAATALTHPHGHEIVGMIYEMHQDAKLNSPPDKRLVAIAISIAKSLEPHNVPYFNKMTSAEIQQWITENSY